MKQSNPTRTPVTCSPLAVVIRGHVSAALLTDPAAPVFCDPRDVCLAGEIDELDVRCPGGCDSRELVSIEPHAVTIAIGHADGCEWWRDVLADAIRRDGDGIAAFAASLAVTGAGA